MVNTYYLDFLKNQSKRYKTNFEKAQTFLNGIINRLRDYNHRNDKVTALFLLSDQIINKYSNTIDLLVYSRIIDKIRISSFGGTGNIKGILCLINPMVAIYYGAFTSQSKINSLPQHLKEALEKDKKVQFSNDDAFINKDDELQISCPRYLDSTCPEPKCKGSFSEEWSICPFHRNLSLEQRLPLAEEISIQVLSISEKMIKRLNDNGILTIKDVLNSDIEGLQQIYQIGTIRSKNIFFLAKEYTDDNLQIKVYY